MVTNTDACRCQLYSFTMFCLLPAVVHILASANAHHYIHVYIYIYIHQKNAYACEVLTWSMVARSRKCACKVRHVRTCSWGRLCVCVHALIYIYTYIHIHAHAAHARMHICMSPISMFACMYACLFANQVGACRTSML